jgi:hypothetical protein
MSEPFFEVLASLPRSMVVRNLTADSIPAGSLVTPEQGAFFSPATKRRRVKILCESPISKGQCLFARVSGGPPSNMGMFSGSPGDGLMPVCEEGAQLSALSDSIEEDGKLWAWTEARGFDV